MRIFITAIFFSILIPLKKDTLSFISANPFSFKDIITDLDNQDKQEVFGILTLPDGIGEFEKIPLIIGVAGSKDWSDHHLEYIDMYQNMGIATFELHSFKSREVASTVGNQIKVTTAMMILDSYRIFEKLSNHPNIDKDKVAITGWSLGGGVTLFSAWKPLKNAINENLSFAAHLSYYPPCIVEPKTLDFSDSPIHLLVGELDDWVPADACVDLASKMRNKGANIEVTVYEKSHHSFDRVHPPRIAKNGYKLEDCRLKMNDEGAVLMNFLNIPMTTPMLQKIGLALCTGGVFAARGPTFGGNPEARHKSFNFSKSFMSEHLLSE
tara:strand:- start:325 stop:1296 length:972 start_codon:yes stop_codon:yes gene_type:complete